MAFENLIAIIQTAVPEFVCIDDEYYNCGTETLPCNNITDKLPNLLIELEGHKFTLPPTAYVYDHAEIT